MCAKLRTSGLQNTANRGTIRNLSATGLGPSSDQDGLTRTRSRPRAGIPGAATRDAPKGDAQRTWLRAADAPLSAPAPALESVPCLRAGAGRG
jgi:hypothetical protein